jgi:hypothetical protein
MLSLIERGALMSYQKAVSVLKSAKLPPSDRVWFGRWIDGYRQFLDAGRGDWLSVSRESVIGFLRQQKAKGRQAWQRLQMVKALEFYQTAVLRSSSPALDDIRETRTKFVRQHPTLPANNVRVIDVAGVIDPNEPEVIQQFRRRLRVLGREYNTEKAYVKWAREFIRRYRAGDIPRLQTLGEAEVTAFLTDLAVERNVAADTQKQAFNALP